MKKLLFSLVFFLGSLVLGVSVGYSTPAPKSEVCYQGVIRCSLYTNASTKVVRVENNSSPNFTEDCSKGDMLVSGSCEHSLESSNTRLKVTREKSGKASDKTWVCVYKVSGSGQDPLKVTVKANCSSCRKEKVEIPCPKK